MCGALSFGSWAALCAVAASGAGGEGKGGAIGGLYRAARYIYRAMSSCGETGCSIEQWRAENPGESEWDDP